MSYLLTFNETGAQSVEECQLVNIWVWVEERTEFPTGFGDGRVPELVPGVDGLCRNNFLAPDND